MGLSGGHFFGLSRCGRKFFPRYPANPWFWDISQMPVLLSQDSERLACTRQAPHSRISPAPVCCGLVFTPHLFGARIYYYRFSRVLFSSVLSAWPQCNRLFFLIEFFYVSDFHSPEFCLGIRARSEVLENSSSNWSTRPYPSLRDYGWFFVWRFVSGYPVVFSLVRVFLGSPFQIVQSILLFLDQYVLSTFQPITCG